MRFIFGSIEVNNLKRDLMLRFTILLSLLLILLIASYTVFLMAISEKENDSLLINLAGKQRMHIYKYASGVNQALLGLATADFKMATLEKNKADLTAKIFEATQKSLRNGGSVSTNGTMFESGDASEIGKIKNIVIISPLIDEVIIAHLQHVDKEWQELKRISLLSLRADVNPISKDYFVRQLHKQAALAVNEADQVVRLIYLYSQKKSKQMKNLLLLMIVMGAVLFICLIYYVYRKIVLPLDSSINIQHRTMESLLVEKNRAEKASHAKSEFLSCMSHELRTPLNAILGFGQLLDLQSNDLNESQQDNVTEILHGGEHLLTLINEVLDLSKIEAGKLEVFIEEVQIEELLQQCLNLVLNQAEERQLEVVDNISCKGYIVKADFTRLKQALLNLLSNAVKYNRLNGRITLDCNITTGQLLCIRITDTGKGLTEEEISKLFVSFERLSAKNSVDGTGIGLVITKHLIELMGGSIGVESKPDEGTTFWVELELFNQSQTLSKPVLISKISS